MSKVYYFERGRYSFYIKEYFEVDGSQPREKKLTTRRPGEIYQNQETADLVTFTEEILNGKLHFLCSGGEMNGCKFH